MRNDSMSRKEKGNIVSFFPTGEFYYTKGMKALEKRELTKAKKYFSRAMDLEPLDPIIACQLAIVETELGHYEQSNGLLHFVLDDLDPRMSECHYFLANNYAHLGSFKDAFRHAQAYLDLNEKGEYSDDAEDLLELITLDNEDAFDDLYEQDEMMEMQEESRYLLESGHFAKAAEHLEKTVKKYPDFWAAYNNLALAYFYLGQTEKAHNVLEDVLEKNPGNLHAICNKIVFYFYEKKQEPLHYLADQLAKIQPLIPDQQFKIGATFALIGRYEDAYRWLKKLQKSGFEGEAGFYYWLAYAAHFTGHPETARSAWKKVIRDSPEKEGLEPWSSLTDESDIERNPEAIVGYLNGDRDEERLFGIFLLSLAGDQKEVMTHPDFCDIDYLQPHEKIYMADVLGMPVDNSLLSEMNTRLAHETALTLYRHFRPLKKDEAGLFMIWFSIFLELQNQKTKLTKPAGLAAAVEYIWRKLRSEQVSQAGVADKYSVSVSTVQKYAKFIRKHLL
ncbi:tetratricopeptide repeat protein [Domibacillus epiphyticus]|uniref:Tetratricopeptide repeat protein n=1 Tax=Domibacillus epiphyticus TaxID=1714355 RepID=A0A1V2AB95_9BACI|nr:tetratricopeptide repeat protein [Domibacillus epiphyticus]OMP68259.1 tetratricopeptide repeat protein [Domibacillus epiphyticus]